MLEAVYIADSKNSLIYEYIALLYSPHFTQLLTVIESSIADEIEDPLRPTEPAIPLIKVNKNFYVCSRKADTLTIYLLFQTSSDDKTSPFVPFVFLNRLVDVMKEYFGSPLTVSKVDANTDTLTLLLNEMADNGIPNTTDANQLRDIVLVKSFLSKILSSGSDLASVATRRTLSSMSNTSKPSLTTPLSKPDEDRISWRSANVKYTNNEMYLDLMETINVTLRPKKSKRKTELLSSQNFDSAFYSTSTITSSTNRLSPISGTINGQLDFLCRLSGEPTLQITLNSASSNLEAPRLHPCVNIDTWQRSKDTLSFIPPDGHSTLMSYEVDLDSLPEKRSLSMLGLPEFDCQLGIGINDNEFEVKIITSKHHGITKIDNIKLDIFAFEQNKSYAASDEDSDEEDKSTSNLVTSMKVIKATHGDFRYKGDGRGEWIIKDLVPGQQPSLRGCIYTTDDEKLPGSSSTPSLHENLIEIANDDSKIQQRPLTPLFYNVSFTYKGGLASGLKVDNLKVISSKGMGESVKPYKGVRYITTTGDYAIRM